MKKDQSKTPLYDAVMRVINDKPTPFSIPSHKFGQGIHPKCEEFAEVFKMDSGEMVGTDDLHMPEGPIKEAQELAAEAWGADQTYFLVNGTSCGIISILSAVASEGEKIIIPRNTHKSIVSGLIFSGAQPVYIPAEIDKEKGLVGGIKPETLEQAYIENPDAKGFFNVSTTYHGICNDTKKLAEITHKHGGVFIADEAHGNHSYFHPDLPKGALTLGADASCQSTHKMSGSLIQSSMLHIKKGKFDTNKLKSNLSMMQTTSPSFLLLASLDLARSNLALHGETIMESLLEMSTNARKKLSKIPGIEVVGKEVIGSNGIVDYDMLRFVISARQLGIEGYELIKILRNDYNIEYEFGDYYYAVNIMGVGTQQEDVNKLVFAIEDIASKYKGQQDSLTWEDQLPDIPPQIVTPREAYFAETEYIPWQDAKGRVSAQMLVPYPPGIATILPGEMITDDVWHFLRDMIAKGQRVHGLIDEGLELIKVIKSK